MQATENEEKRMAQFAEEKERKMRLRAEREAGEGPCDWGGCWAAWLAGEQRSWGWPRQRVGDAHVAA